VHPDAEGSGERAVLSIPSTETLRPVRVPPPPPQSGADAGEWWKRYSLALRSFSPDARRAIEHDSAMIAAAAMPSADGPAVRTGIVVGSVQSGKTASMLAVAALLLDQGLDVLVVLSGTRIPLWLQTYERLLEQLDGSSPESAWSRDRERALVPAPADVLGESVRVDPATYLAGMRVRVRQAGARRKPCIFVIPKEDDHLHALARLLDDVWPDEVQLSEDTEPLRMVVLDDEADDASLLSAEQGERVTPEYIQRLWSSWSNPRQTRSFRLRTTYVAYTATPQANYLQASHNPLAPRAFHFALRTPSSSGALEPRELTFFDREGLPAHYVGGHDFYERLSATPGDLCSTIPYPTRLPNETQAEYQRRFQDVELDLLGEALRSYLVAGAMRLLDSHKSFEGLSSGASFQEAELRERLPPPHTMLFHPSALIDRHFLGSELISRWSATAPGAGAVAEVLRDPVTDAPTLDSDGLRTRLDAEEHLWERWMDRFTSSGRALIQQVGNRGLAWGDYSWPDVRRVLAHEVFDNVKMRVLNSDPRAHARPEFGPRGHPESPNHLVVPRDIFSIFVAGNVLSRGLTLDGLTTSLFIRSSAEPAADTQMQMQRWFGYRGRYLRYCRVFMFNDQFDLFQAYHSHDTALKSEIMQAAERGGKPFAHGVLVLQGHGFKATHKVPTSRMPLHPGPTPAVRLIEPEDTVENQANIGLLSSLLEGQPWSQIAAPPGTVRGLILHEPLTLLGAAEVLEGLRYSRHDPDPIAEQNSRWASLQNRLGLNAPIFRPPGRQPGTTAADPSGCPYTIAAYLRLWDAALSSDIDPGLFPTDQPGVRWAMVDRRAYRRSAPAFYIAVRFGSEVSPRDHRLASTGARTMRRQSVSGRPWLLETLWGTRGHGHSYFGDQYLDYHYHETKPVPELHRSNSWRPRGHPGLILFHIIRHERGHDAIAVGVGIPHGGPDHVAALRG
jgi:hypothetical protein